MKEELDLWRSVTEVPDAAVSELRVRVLNATSRNRWRMPLRPAALAAGVIIAMALPFQLWRPLESIDVRPLPAPAAPALTGSTAPSQPRPLARVVPPKPVEEVSWMRIETPDPDVVIYLVGSEGGGE